MKKYKDTNFSAFGGSSLLAAFGILCLVVLAMLSIVTVQSDRRQAESTEQSVAAFYAADRQAQNIYARLKLGEMPEEVVVDGDLFKVLIKW